MYVYVHARPRQGLWNELVVFAHLFRYERDYDRRREKDRRQSEFYVR